MIQKLGIKALDPLLPTWDQCTQDLLDKSNRKLKIVMGVALIMFFFIVVGFYHLYPLKRKTEYLMVVNDPVLGNYLIRQSCKQYLNKHNLLGDCVELKNNAENNVASE